MTWGKPLTTYRWHSPGRQLLRTDTTLILAKRCGKDSRVFARTCSCKERLDRRSRIEDITGQKPETMVEFQMMFRRIYPANTIRDSAMHLAEEVGELDEAIEHYAGTHQGNLFEEIVIELVDEITNICAVASCLNVDLAFAMEQNFAHGCPKCVGTPCTCGYTVSKVM